MMYNICEYLLTALRREGAEGICIVTSSAKDELTSRGEHIKMRRSTEGITVRLQAFSEGRVGSASFSGNSREAMDDAVKTALASARSAPADGAAPAPGLGKLEWTTGAAPDPELLLERTAELLRDGKREFPKANIDILSAAGETTEMLFASTAGTEALQKNGFYSLFTMYTGVDGEGLSSMNASIFTTYSLGKPWLDQWMLRASVGNAEKQIITRPFEGKYVGRVIMAPDVLYGSIGPLLRLAGGEASLVSGTARWKDKLGQRVLDNSITVSAAPLHPDMVAFPRISEEGYLLEDQPLIEGGILRGFRISERGARKAGVRRSGNDTSALLMSGGEKSLEEIISEVDRGIIIGRYSGSSPDAAGNFSGVAKNSFLIEGGKVRDALSEVMISGNLYEMYGEGCRFSRELVSSGSSIMPWGSVGHVTISGK